MDKPEDRYVNLETKTLSNGRVVYASARPVKVIPKETDPVVVVSELDRMDIIANNAYGSPIGWWRIAAANGLSRGTLHVKAGTPLIIPSV